MAKGNIKTFGYDSKKKSGKPESEGNKGPWKANMAETVALAPKTPSSPNETDTDPSLIAYIESYTFQLVDLLEHKDFEHEGDEHHPLAIAKRTFQSAIDRLKIAGNYLKESK